MKHSNSCETLHKLQTFRKIRCSCLGLALSKSGLADTNVSLGLALSKLRFNDIVDFVTHDLYDGQECFTP